MRLVLPIVEHPMRDSNDEEFDVLKPATYERE